MALGHSPSIVRNGLVFYYDMANTKKSWKGKPTTNLTPDLSIGAIQSEPVVTYVGVENGWKKYSLNGTWTAGTYPYSIGIGSVAFTGGQTYSSSLYIKTNVADKFVSLFTGMNYVNEPMNNVGTSFSIAQPDGSIYVGRSGFQYTNTVTQTGYLLSQPKVGQTFNAATDFVYIKEGQVELGSFPTPYVNGTRSNTQAVVDLTGQKTATATSLIYNSNNTFTFSESGSSTLVTNMSVTDIPALSNWTLETWVKCTAFPTVSAPNGYGVTYKSGVLFGATYYSGAALYWYGNSSGNVCTIYGFIRGTDNYRATSGYNLPLNTPTHLACVHDYTANKLRLYVNGSLFSEVQGATAEYSAANAPQAGNIGVNKPQVDGGGTANYSYFNGDVYSAKVYTKALTATEVAQNFNAHRDRYGI